MSERELIHKMDWGAIPPRTDAIYAPILSPKAGETCHSLVVCPEFLRVRTHWYMGRTTGCVGEENGCAGCREKLAKKWRGYWGVMRLDDGRAWMAEFTPQAYRDSAQQLDHAEDYVGWHLVLSRPGKSKFGKVRSALRPPTREEKELVRPMSWDAKRSLLLVWRHIGKIATAPPADDEDGGGVPT